MSQCVYVQVCQFINGTISENEALTNLLKSKHCYDSKQECARLLAASELGGMHRVPSDLWPDDMEGARSAIAAANEAMPTASRVRGAVAR